MMEEKESRPSLAKTRGDRLVAARVFTSLRSSDGRFRELFDAADVISEGSVQQGAGSPVWYGTTSLVLAWPRAVVDPATRDFIAEVAARDPHVRLRAVRAARREASLRAPGSLGRVFCEIRMTARPEGLRIDVDVQAPLPLPRGRELPSRSPSA